MRPYFVLRHPCVREDAHEKIERIIGECSAVIGKRRWARRVVKQNIWKQCPRHSPRLSGRISTRMLQSVREGSKEPPIVRRFTREVRLSVFDEQYSLLRPRSLLRLDPPPALTWRKLACPQAKHV